MARFRTTVIFHGLRIFALRFTVSRSLHSLSFFSFYLSSRILCLFRRSEKKRKNEVDGWVDRRFTFFFSPRKFLPHARFIHMLIDKERRMIMISKMGRERGKRIIRKLFCKFFVELLFFLNCPYVWTVHRLFVHRVSFSRVEGRVETKKNW